MYKTVQKFLAAEMATFMVRRKTLEGPKAPSPMVLSLQLVSLLDRLENLGYIKIHRYRKKLYLHQKPYELDKPAWSEKTLAD